MQINRRDRWRIGALAATLIANAVLAVPRAQADDAVKSCYHTRGFCECMEPSAFPYCTNYRECYDIFPGWCWRGQGDGE